MDIAEEVKGIELAEGVYLNVGKVTVSLILICLVGYILDFFMPGLKSSLAFGASMPVYTILTSVFMHGNIVHLFYNVLNLFIFGNLIELHYGSKPALILFLSSAVLANLVFAWFYPYSRAIGISGVVYALIGTSVILAPNAKIPLPIGGIAFPMKVWFAGPVMAIGEFLLSFISFDNIAHIAHASGFVVGFAIAAAIKIRSRQEEEFVMKTDII